MSTWKIDPSVKEFKAFINKHPRLIANIRKTGRSWQEYYEKWVLLGEDDVYWEKFKQPKLEEVTKGKKSEIFTQIMNLTNQIDFDKVQQQVSQLNKTLSTVQQLINQYKRQHDPTPRQPGPHQMFNFFRD
ncbi:MAG TPA: spore coat protein YlbD [Cerasibacillus sp.]|uniref:spore coat protein YlbD n=1 Tax=Cerasibacillus sp. TaxID=2498711 RepID=UPI002F3EDFA3